MISSDTSSFLVGKLPRKASNGKWHLFRSEGSASVCGRDCWDKLHQRVEPRTFEPGNDDSLSEVIGLGEVCSSCREYITGQLEDNALPKPTNGRKKKRSLLKSWKGEEKKSGGRMYG